MKQAHLFLCLIAAVVLTACQKKDDPVVDDTPRTTRSRPSRSRSWKRTKSTLPSTSIPGKEIS